MFVQNVDSTVNLAGAAGVSRVMVTLPGSGYLKPPIVTFNPMKWSWLRSSSDGMS
jgi:hypothetical protein